MADTFEVYVRLPAGYVPGKRTYRLSYILDANAYWDQLKPDTETIFVGITYPPNRNFNELRQRDFAGGVIRAGREVFDPGAPARFLNFMESELDPWIRKRYHVKAGGAALYGHSLGGYFGLYALLRGSPVFRYYFLASPSVDEEDESLTKLLREELLNSVKPVSSLYISCGGKEKTMSFRKWSFFLESKVKDNRFEVLPGKDHMETALPLFQQTPGISFP